MRMKGKRGDQAFIEDALTGSTQLRPLFWQDLLPGQVVSYKNHIRGKEKFPARARVVCFHGKPRPWGVNENWAAKQYAKPVEVGDE